MKPCIFSALAFFVVKKSLLGVIADTGIEAIVFTKKNVNEPHGKTILLLPFNSKSYFSFSNSSQEILASFKIFLNKPRPTFSPE